MKVNTRFLYKIRKFLCLLLNFYLSINRAISQMIMGNSKIIETFCSILPQIGKKNSKDFSYFFDDDIAVKHDFGIWSFQAVLITILIKQILQILVDLLRFKSKSSCL